MLVLLHLSAPASPAAEIDRFVNGLKHRSSYAVQIVTENTSLATSPFVTSRVTLAIRNPFWADLELVVPKLGQQRPLHWIYDVHGAKISGYDAVRNATSSQNLGSPAPAPAVLAAEVGQAVPEGALEFLSPKQVGRFTDKYRTLTGWTHRVKASKSIWSGQEGPLTVTLVFDTRSGKLTRLERRSKHKGYALELSYPPLTRIPRFKVPAGAVPLDSFRIPPVPRLFRVKETANVFDRCFDAYERTLRVHATIKEEGQITHVWRDGSAVTQVGPAGGWRWASGVLTIWPKAGGVYEGKPDPGQVASLLRVLDLTVTPLARTFVNDDNFANVMLPVGYQAKVVGSVKVGGGTVSLLEILGPGAKINAEIGANGLVRRLDSTAFDSNGKPMLETTHEFTYGPLGTPGQPPKGKRKELPPPPPKPSAPGQL